MNQDIITLDYGSGGRKTAQLIDELLLPAFQSDTLNALGDGAVLDLSGPLVFSTDSFVVSPLFFPGGDIGKLSVCGTVNDLAMCGGIPRYLSLSFIIEEGLAVEELKCIISSIARTARAAGVEIVTGDTKVVERGRGDGIYINTSGIGTLTYPGLSPDNIREGDAVLISGSIGDHGATVMMARNGLLEGSPLSSDCQPLHKLAKAAWSCGGVRVLRDPTRGGVATTLANAAKEAIGCKVRGIEFSLLQRCAAHCGSLTDVNEAHMAGEQAVKKAVEGFTDYCIGFERATDEAGNYKCLPKMIPLSDIANTEKKLPREWINAEGNFITEDYVKYALPLIQGESHPPIEDGLPRFAHLAKIK